MTKSHKSPERVALEQSLHFMELHHPDWLSEVYVKKTTAKLRKPELALTWEKLAAACKPLDLEYFVFACVEAEADYRFQCGQTPNLRSAALEKLERHLLGISVLLKQFPSLSVELTAMQEEQLYLIEKHPDLEVHRWTLHFTDAVRNLRKQPQPESSVSNKRGKAGLSAFYTNALCAFTTHSFQRPCYNEIAEIANVVLEVPANTAITAENVRMNYRNFKLRKKNPKA